MACHKSEVLYFTTDDDVHLVCVGNAHEEYFDIEKISNHSVHDVRRAWEKHLQEFSEVEHNNAFSKET